MSYIDGNLVLFQAGPVSIVLTVGNAEVDLAFVDAFATNQRCLMKYEATPGRQPTEISFRQCHVRRFRLNEIDTPQTTLDIIHQENGRCTNVATDIHEMPVQTRIARKRPCKHGFGCIVFRLEDLIQKCNVAGATPYMKVQARISNNYLCNIFFV